MFARGVEQGTRDSPTQCSPRAARASRAAFRHVYRRVDRLLRTTGWCSSISGTGQSTRMDAQALSHLDTDEARVPALLRQDQIVYDAEALRRRLCVRMTVDDARPSPSATITTSVHLHVAGSPGPEGPA